MKMRNDSMDLRNTLIGMATAACLAACNRDETMQSGPGPVASVEVSPVSATLAALGETVALTATARDAGGTMVPVESFTWSSSDEAVGIVNQDGVVTAEANGETVITAAVDGSNGSATVTVETNEIRVSPDGTTGTAAGGQVHLVFPPGAVAQDITVTVDVAANAPNTPQLVPGTTFDLGPAGTQFNEAVQLTIEYNGAQIPEGIPDEDIRLHRDVGGEWEETEDSEVNLDFGWCRGKVLDAAAYGCAGRAVAAVEVMPAEATIAVDETVQLAVELTDKLGNVLKPRPVEWMSEDDGIATVDGDGLVTGVDEGIVTITATSEGVDGTAEVTVEAEPPPAGDLICGDLASGSIEAAGEVDIYRFDADAGTEILLTIGETAGFAGTDARVTLLSPSLAQLLVFDSNAQVRASLADAGIYTIQVNANNLTGTGSYNLTLTCLAPLGPAEALMPGDLAAGDLDVGAKVDLYSLEGMAGDEILLTLGEAAGFAGADARVVLWSPTFVDVIGFDSNGQMQVSLPESGTYAVTVTANNITGTGSYSLSYERLSPLEPVDAALVPGDLVAGDLDVVAKVDVYSLEGMAGDAVLLTLGEASGFAGADARVVLWSPTFAQVIAFDSNGQAVATVPETGTYAVTVTANNITGTGSYSLSYERLAPLGPVEAVLMPGDLVAGNLDAVAQVDVYSFEGTAGDEVLLTIAETGGFAGADARVVLWSPTVVQVTAFDSDGQSQVNLTETGTYVVTVTANNIIGTGTYNLGFERLSP